MLKPVEIENAEISETSWTKMEKLNKTTINELDELCSHSQNSNELSTIPPWSSFQSGSSNCNRQSVILKDAHVLQEA